MKYILLGAMILSLISPHISEASEGQLWLDVNVSSSHSRDYWWENLVTNSNGDVVSVDEHKFNESNPGIGLTYGQNDYIDWTGGVLKNSFDVVSIYGGGILKYPLNLGNGFRIEPGILLAVATGYDQDVNKDHTYDGLLPYVIPNITLIVADTFYARVGWVPDFDGDPKTRYESNDQVGLVTLQFGVNIY